jgi:hypothetical protein
MTPKPVPSGLVGLRLGAEVARVWCLRPMFTLLRIDKGWSFVAPACCSDSSGYASGGCTIAYSSEIITNMVRPGMRVGHM